MCITFTFFLVIVYYIHVLAVFSLLHRRWVAPVVESLNSYVTLFDIMASVTVNMRLCGKTHKVNVVLDGMDLKVSIDTDCDHVRQYSEKVKTISMDDATDMKASKVVSYDSTMMMTPTCLVPKAVLYAAWMEIGMISPTRAKEVKENSISFV